MLSPYALLGVSVDATDEAIKQAYLNKVKATPPDRDPDLFRQIKEAYQTLKDRESRLQYELLTLPSADFDQLLDRAFDLNAVPALSTAQLKRLLLVSQAENS